MLADGSESSTADASSPRERRAALKAEIGRPRLEAVPADPADRDAIEATLERFGELTAGSPRAVAVRLRPVPTRGSSDVVRALDAEGLAVVDLQLHAPSLDDVFLAKTGRLLEGAEKSRRSPRPSADELADRHAGRPARPALGDAHLSAAGKHRARARSSRCCFSPSTPPGSARRRASRDFPTDSYLDFALGFAFMQGALFTTTNAGTDLARDIETGFLSRLTLTPLRRSALLTGHLAGAVSIGLIQAIVYLTVGLALGVHLDSGPGGRSRPHRARSADRHRLRWHRRCARAAHGLRRGDSGLVSAFLRVALSLLDEHAAQSDGRRLVPHDRDLQPRLVPDRGTAEPDHHGLGPDSARARLRHRDPIACSGRPCRRSRFARRLARS